MTAAIELIQRIFHGRSKAPYGVRQILEAPAIREILDAPPTAFKHKSKRSRRSLKYVKGVQNGYFVRIKVPPRPAASIKESSKTTTPTSSQRTILPNATTTESTTSSHPFSFYEWFRSNLPVITLNFGSICILLGFSRSDILELRAMTTVGQLTFAFYNLSQATILWPSVAWSTLFASVNTVKIFDTIQERHGEVHMNAQDLKVYTTHFMPHGITPKQFERISHKATVIQLKQGEFLIRKGCLLDKVFLVTEGSTHAHILGRHLTGVSTRPQDRHPKEGGDSGAWVGEMTFLDTLWEQKPQPPQATGAAYGKPVENTKNRHDKFHEKQGSGISLYTILADSDCSVMTWTYDDMAEVMESSTDLRASLTRAMTSAVVGKVVNLSISQTTLKRGGAPRWLSAWLSDWKREDGTKIVQVRDDEPALSKNDEPGKRNEAVPTAA